ncbi:hypothetical protein [Sulfobacillus harzensis]|uniref:Uncharacterized protein n=1 Tax=Sulfobacillus harzensis TaxID=2729629 RepID=A0A7Y0L470_9FIRM|nr:hypothetical protein [Sulfobacillus harzensis]NMP23009.1 hypothetical protein [Sulfobacillus harzensis]
MTCPIYWMPQCDLGTVPDDRFRRWHGQRFLSLWGNRGHILAPGPEIWPSMETLMPMKNHVWYCRTWQKVPARSKPAACTVELPVPHGVADAALTLLNRVLDVLPLKRLVLTRPAGLALDAAEHSILTLMDSVTDRIWLDAASFGWTGLSYLLAQHPHLQAVGAAEPQLVRLAEITKRPLQLMDFSGQPAVDIPLLPRYPIFPDEYSRDNSLPPGWRSR